MTSRPRAPDPQSISPRARVWTRFVAKQIFLERLVKEKPLYFDTRWAGSGRQPAENTSPRSKDLPKSPGTDFGKIENLVKIVKNHDHDHGHVQLGHTT